MPKRENTREWCIQNGIAPRENNDLRLRFSLYVAKVSRRLWSQDPARAEAFLSRLYRGDRAKVFSRLFWALRPIDRSESERYAVQAVEAGSNDVEALKVYVGKAYKKGELDGLSVKGGGLRKVKRFRRLLDNIESSESLLRNGYPLASKRIQRPIGSIPKRSFYLLHNSLPINSGGYATRTHGLLLGIKAAGYDPFGVTRRGFPHDRGAEYANGNFDHVDIVDGIPYLRNLSPTGGLGKVPMKRYIWENIAAHTGLVRAFRPEIIHGVSNFINGVTANALAQEFGLKSVYEVRGLWEVTRMSREPAYKGSDAYNLYVRMETEACLHADQVFVLTEALKREMERRGVDPEKMTVVPNGVDTSRFVPRPENRELKSSLGFDPDDAVIGFVGSVVDYEGLDDLLHAVAKLKGEGLAQTKLLIVGDGAVWESCKALARDLDLEGAVVFTGRVPHSQVEDYYSIIDIAPFPRKSLPVCEMVSPLKPFEAMAMGKAVIMSDVAAMAEIVRHEDTGLLFEKGSQDALTAALRRLVTSHAIRDQLGERARDFTVKERDWAVIARRITTAYDRLREPANS